MKPFKIKQSEDGQFYFVLVSGNGKVIMTSETYTRKRDAKKAALRSLEVIGDAAMNVEEVDQLIEDQTA